MFVMLHILHDPIIRGVFTQRNLVLPIGDIYTRKCPMSPLQHRMAPIHRTPHDELDVHVVDVLGWIGAMGVVTVHPRTSTGTHRETIDISF
jgi:hypothetical protein